MLNKALNKNKMKQKEQLNIRNQICPFRAILFMKTLTNSKITMNSCVADWDKQYFMDLQEYRSLIQIANEKKKEG